jgi:acyl carrier protein
MVGGEPLPTALVERLRPRFPGALCNMYGPTETTIWSTTSSVEPGARITIGKPIANTTIHIVDRRQRTLPVGVPGELLIGGAGVVRGYLARPELTAERFVSDPTSTDGGRLYRTGDLARWLPSGDVEFLGRLDHQIKVRGYRIELGEIESVLGEHPAVRETVVVAREGAGGDTRLVAYIVPRKEGEAGGASIPSNWEAIWDETYKDTHDRAAGFNTAGWNSSFTGLPLPESYIHSQLEPQGLTDVSLEQLAADALSQLAAPGPFDLIVVNSVIQYFPDAEYLARVLRAAYERLAPGGAIFVGDVRSLQHLEAFHIAIEMARSDASSTIADLKARLKRRAAEEGELLIDPAFFQSIARELGDATFERAELKPGRARNEMTGFRYDVILRKDGGKTNEDSPVPEMVTCAEPCSLDTLRTLLRGEPASFHVTGVSNARLVAEVRAAELVSSGQGGATVVDLRAAAGAGGAGVDPEDVRALDPRYEALIEFSPERPDWMDVTFRHRTKQPVLSRAQQRVTVPASLATYANTPAKPAATGTALIPILREQARQKLPEYMVPSAFVLMDALPLTPNGKIDRKALPAPERPQSGTRTNEPPKNGVERGIVSVLQELLGGGDISVDDNFFDLGANSLMMVQASVRLRSLLGRPVPLVRMFQHPTARALAAALGDTEPSAAPEVKQSQDRAQIRRDAMQRRRESTQTRR